MNYIEDYYAAIQSGEINVSRKVRAVYKHLTDKLHDDGSPFVFDERSAQRPIDFIQKFCHQRKGTWARQLMKLELWELALLSALFGFVNRKTGLRQYRICYLFVGRKNGKSTLSAAIGLYLMVADNEDGPEIYSAATEAEQSRIIWSEAVSMVKKSPELRKRLKCIVSQIRYEKNDGIFKPLSSKTDSMDGLNVHGGLIDELHAIKNMDIFDQLDDGSQSREQPLIFVTSTNGTVRENVFDKKYDECTNIINGYDDPDGYHDETVLPIMYELDSRKEWTIEKCWYKANPSLGTIKKLDRFRHKIEMAKADPTGKLKDILCKDFNLRETSTEAFLSYDDLNNDAKYDITQLKPRYAIGGVDLSATTDLTCCTIIFKMDPDDEKIYCHQMYWLPEDLLEQRAREDKIPYQQWADNGWLRTSPGNQIDYRLLTKWFKEMMEEYDVFLYRIGYDSWSAKYFVMEMTDEFGDAVMEPVIQGKKTLSGPMKSLKAELQKNHIIYNNNPLLKWCMSNVAVDVDKNMNIQPAKQHSQRLRIDGFASLLDAYVVYERNKQDYLNII